MSSRLVTSTVKCVAVPGKERAGAEADGSPRLTLDRLSACSNEVGHRLRGESVSKSQPTQASDPDGVRRRRGNLNLPLADLQDGHLGKYARDTHQHN